MVHVVTAQAGTQEFRELRERNVDLMLGRLFRPIVDSDIAMETLSEDRLFVVTGAQSPWARRRKIGLSELMDEPWVLFPPNNIVSSSVAEFFQANKLEPPRKRVISFSLDVRMHLLATGRYLTMLSALVLHYNAKRWSLKPLPVDVQIAPPVVAFTLKNRTTSPVVQLFLEHARAEASLTTRGRTAA